MAIKVNNIDVITNARVITNLSSPVGVDQGGTGAATLTGVLIGNGTSAVTTKTNPAGAFVGTTDTQTLTNKGLTAPSISGGTIDNAVIGGTTPVAATFTALTATGNVGLGDSGSDTVTVAGQVSANGSVGTSGWVLSSRGANLSPQWIDPMAATTPVASGGTGSTTAAGARTNLGLVIGTDIPSPTGTGASGAWNISAATLTTARTINGVSFNGSANITIGAPTVSAGDNYYLGEQVTGSTTNSNPVRVLATKVLVSGTVRVQWVLQSGLPGSFTAFGRVYKNGVATGTLRSTSSIAAVFTDDVTVTAGDNIEIYIYTNAGVDYPAVAQGINIGTSVYTTFAPHLGATVPGNYFSGV
jgi:hypothetical protein